MRGAAAAKGRPGSTLLIAVALGCLLLIMGCHRGRVAVPGGIGPVPAGFPRQLLGFSGPVTAFGPDGKAWDAYGIGAPSNVLRVGGNYWMCTQGYTAEGNISQAIGCWFGEDLQHLKPYPGNPVLVNPGLPWTKSCLEGPDLNSDGTNVYLSYVAFSQNCDDLGHGSIGISSTQLAKWPADLSAVPAQPQIPLPHELAWLFRPFLVEIGGICYDYSNGGIRVPKRFHPGFDNQPVIASFRTSGPCATTEMNPREWRFNRLELTNGQPWEGPFEVEEPQVFAVDKSTWVMLYGGAWTYKAGYAYTHDPVHGSWTKLDTNPIHEDGVLWLPRLVQDERQQFWMFGNFNNTRQMQLWKADGK